MPEAVTRQARLRVALTKADIDTSAIVVFIVKPLWRTRHASGRKINFSRAASDRSRMKPVFDFDGGDGKIIEPMKVWSQRGTRHLQIIPDIEKALDVVAISVCPFQAASIREVDERNRPFDFKAILFERRDSFVQRSSRTERVVND